MLRKSRVLPLPKRPVQHTPLGLKWQRFRSAGWMIAPALLLYAIFVVYPIGLAIWLSFYQWDGFSQMEWVGLRNYRLVLDDPVFWLALRHTFLFALVVTVAKNGAGLLLALLLSQPVRGQAFFRTAIFLPVTMSFVVIGLLWSWIYNPIFGLLNMTLQSVGLERLIQGWLSEPSVALWSIMLVDIWKWTGFHTLLFLVGLRNIPRNLYEAAMIDGATPWNRFISITLPLLKPVTAVSISLSLIGSSVSNYDLVYVMTGGGPNHATEVAQTWIVTTAFRFASLGKASAMSIILFVMVFVIGIFQLIALTRHGSALE